MNKKEAQGAWLVVGVLFVSWFIVWGGGANTGAVFFPPVLKSFRMDPRPLVIRLCRIGAVRRSVRAGGRMAARSRRRAQGDGRRRRHRRRR